MNDKKEWREFWIGRYFKNTAWFILDWRHLKNEKPSRQNAYESVFKVIEHAAFEAEKQRADRLEKENQDLKQQLSEASAGRDQWRAAHLKNQKLKEALKLAREALDAMYWLAKDYESMPVTCQPTFYKNKKAALEKCSNAVLEIRKALGI